MPGGVGGAAGSALGCGVCGAGGGGSCPGSCAGGGAGCSASSPDADTSVCGACCEERLVDGGARGQLQVMLEAQHEPALERALARQYGVGHEVLLRNDKPMPMVPCCSEHDRLIGVIVKLYSSAHGASRFDVRIPVQLPITIDFLVCGLCEKDISHNPSLQHQDNRVLFGDNFECVGTFTRFWSDGSKLPLLYKFKLAETRNEHSINDVVVVNVAKWTKRELESLDVDLVHVLWRCEIFSDDP